MTSPHVQESLAAERKSGQDRFVFAVCQQGAEKPLKERLAISGSPLRLAFSRPGLVTFKTSGDSLPMLTGNWLARVAGEGLGNVRGTTAEEMVSEVLAIAPPDIAAIHIFQRDQALPVREALNQA